MTSKRLRVRFTYLLMNMENTQAVRNEQKTTVRNAALPIIFIHNGYSRYLEYTLRQARLTNPQATIYLFGDDATKQFTSVTHADLRTYEQRAYPFQNIYKHLSHNTWQFEFYCFQRYFVLKEIMEAFGMEGAFLCDSDLMLYCEVAEEAKHYQFDRYLAGFLVHPTKREAIGHSAYWSYRGLKLFCDYLIAIYSTPASVQQLEAEYKANFDAATLTGYISDMHLLYMFYEKYKDQLLDLYPVYDDTAFDYNVFDHGLQLHYKMDRSIWYGVKQIFREGKKIYCYNTTLDRKVRFNTLHFAGITKMIIHKFYQGNDIRGIYLKDEWQYQKWNLKKTLRIRTRVNDFLKLVGVKK